MAELCRKRKGGLADEAISAFRKARTGAAACSERPASLRRKRAWDPDWEQDGDRKRQLSEQVSLGVAKALDELVGVDAHEHVIEARVEERVEDRMDEVEKRLLPEFQKLEETIERDDSSLRVQHLEAELHAAHEERRAALGRAFHAEQGYEEVVRAWGRDVHIFNAECSRVSFLRGGMSVGFI